MRVELDVVHDGCTLEEAVAELTRDLEIATRVVTEHGPGGGWPVVEFSGSDEQMHALLRRYDDAL